MDNAVRRTSSTGLGKSKEAKERAKMGKESRKLDARQYMFATIGCFAIAWAISATVVLLQLTIQYAFGTVVQNRLDYSAEGAAEWARAVAEKDVGQAYEAWHLLNTSIIGLVYREPEDYTNLANVLAPAFDTLPALHSIQLAFSDRPSEVYVSRQRVSLRQSSVLMKSTSSECFLLGPDACVEQLAEDVHGGSRPQWYLDAQALRPPQISTFQWASEPQIVVETKNDGTDFFSVCIRLLFRAAFPRYPATVFGQVMIQLAALSGERLVDSRLGDEGKIMLVDASGILLAAKDPMDLLKIDNGIVRMSSLAEVDADCGSVVQKASSSGSIEQKQDDSSELIIVEPLSHSMDRFAIVVKAPSVTPFTNTLLLSLAVTSAFVGPSPYVIAATVLVVIFGSQCIYSLRHQETKDDGSKSPLMESKGGGWLAGFTGGADEKSLMIEDPTTRPSVQAVKVAGPLPAGSVQEEAAKAMDTERVEAAARMHRVMKELAKYEKQEAERLEQERLKAEEEAKFGEY